MNIKLTYFDGKDVIVENLEHVKPPQIAGPVIQIFDEFENLLKSAFLITRLIRMDFEHDQIKPVTLN